MGVVFVGCEVELVVQDDGGGLDPEEGEGSGLLGMRERAVLIGATFSIESGEPGGTTVRLRLAAR